MFLPKRKPNSWYPEFMGILFETGCEDTVAEIDPDIYKSKYRLKIVWKENVKHVRFHKILLLQDI
jgi:hypothetical protein